MQNLEPIVNHLVLKCDSTDSNNLYHGKLGIGLALFLYGKYTKDNNLYDLASCLLRNTVYHSFPNDFSIENGLCGIGIGYSLLYKYGMFNDNLNDILEDVDARLMQYNIGRITDKSFRSGLAGIKYYINLRQSINQELLSIDKQFIDDVNFHLQENSKFDYMSIFNYLKAPNIPIDDYLNMPLGLDAGCSYFLINKVYDKIFYI